jgi:hypothetical protein
MVWNRRASKKGGKLVSASQPTIRRENTPPITNATYTVSD